MTLKDLAVQSAREAFGTSDINRIVTEVLESAGMSRVTAPVCQTCRVPMRPVKDDLYQCPRCKSIEMC